MMLPTSKTNVQPGDRGRAEENELMPRQKVEQQADPPASPLPSRHRHDLVPAARDLSRLKSKDETGCC